MMAEQSTLDTADGSAETSDPSLYVDLAVGHTDDDIPPIHAENTDLATFVPASIERLSSNGVVPMASRPAFAPSPAFMTLVRELRNYLNGEIRGRSFLVSGHRGSGKTSMVLRAVEDLYVEAMKGGSDDGSAPNQRPLLIRLNGPSLLASMSTGEGTNGETGDQDSGGTGAENKKAADQNDTVERILSQIMISIYRALTAELVSCYRAHIDGREMRRRYMHDAVETVGQLSLELDNAPAPDVLRDYWHRAGALDTGIFWPFEHDRSRHQGVLELVAVSTAAQAYRVVSGAVTYQTKKIDEASQQASVENASTLAGKEIADKVLGVLTGGLVGGALVWKGQGEVLSAAIIGLATAIISSWSFKFIAKREKKRSATQEYTFIRQSDVSTLDRELPVVIERIREAGLAPVFVIDELDKIDKIETAMEGLVKRLKHIVADRSFFCFLTDRDYYEYLSEQSKRFAYPQEHTYFTHRLFALYRPQDLNDYLRRIIVADRSEQDTDLFRTLVSYLVIHRAMLHVFDLQRELSKICDDNGTITVKLRELLSHYGYRFHITAQLAIELLLSEDEMRDRVNQDPHFGQLAYDALFYPSRKWAEGAETLDISPEAIHRYLAGRINPDWAKAQLEETADGAEPPPTASQILAKTISETDRAFLIEQVERLAQFLSEPETLSTALSDSSYLSALVKESSLEEKHRRVVLELIPKGEQKALAETDNGFLWTHDYFGRPLRPSVPDTDDLLEEGHQSAVEVANGQLTIAQSLFAVTGGFTFDTLVSFGLLSRTPDSREVAAAGKRLRDAEETGKPYDERETQNDENLVREFAEMLLQRSELALACIALAGEVGYLAGTNDRFRSGILGLNADLNLADTPPQVLRTQVLDLLSEVWPEHQVSSSIINSDKMLAILKQIEARASRLSDEGSLEKHATDYWSLWRHRLESGDFSTPAISDLVVQSLGRNGTLITEGLRDNTVRGLTCLFLWSLRTGLPVLDKGKILYIPAWARVWSLAKLGWWHILLHEKAYYLQLDEIDVESWGWLESSFGDDKASAQDAVLIVSDNTDWGPQWAAEPGVSAVQLQATYLTAEFSEELSLLASFNRFSLILIEIDEKGLAPLIEFIGILPNFYSDRIVLMERGIRLHKASKMPVIECPDSLGEAVRLAREAFDQWGDNEPPPVTKKRSARRPAKRKR